jgi:long-chain acyl-CoA synthetase
MSLPEFGECIIRYDSPDNIVDLIENALEKFTDRNVFGTKDEDGIYQWITYGEFGKRIKNLTGGLGKIGVSKGDKVGIISTNRVEWAVGFYATESLGAAWVPMYEKELFSVWKYIVEDAGIKILLVANEEIYE